MAEVPAPAALAAELRRRHPARAAFVQIDPEADSADDLDLLVFDDGTDLRIRRLPACPGLPALDLICLPAALLDAPDRLAANGLLAHRLVASQPLLDDDPRARPAWQAVCRHWTDPAPQAARIAAQLEMARLTVQEVGISREHPAIALFWLQIAHAACVAALCDAHGLAAPNVYTRPLLHARRVEPACGLSLAAPMARVLRLHADPAEAAATLTALHAEVTARCPEPAWPGVLGESTRSEFRYWSQPAELQARLGAAAAMAAQGDAAGAVAYLRYAGYSVVRLAMLHARAAEGMQQHVSFLRPERAVGADLQQHSPAALALLERLLGGGGPAAGAALGRALAEVPALQVRLRAALSAAGVACPPWPRWAPWSPAGGSRNPYTNG